MIKAICSKKELSENSYYEHIRDIIESDEFIKLKDITHHRVTTRYQHCINVSYHNYVICRKLGFDAVSAARAWLLHDLFYYNRKEYNKSHKALSHSRFHSLVALDNALKLTEINDRERDIIENHMWPATKQRPKYKESYIIVVVDKYCAILEVCLPKLKKLMQMCKRG